MTETLRIAVVQSRIEPDIAANGAHIRTLLAVAADRGATLALFPEGALSGYAKAQIRAWDRFDWSLLACELAETRALAAQLGITAALGSAQPVPDRRPHNSLQVLPAGPRYDKRFLSYSEVSDWYTPGRKPVTFTQSGFSLGMTLCIEMQFPELFAGYETLGVDAILHATYGIGPAGEEILQAHAATNCLWLAVATPANAAESPSGIVGPHGDWLARCGSGVDMAVVTLDRSDPRFDIALNKARPWRRVARQGRIYRDAMADYAALGSNRSDTPLMQ